MKEEKIPLEINNDNVDKDDRVDIDFYFFIIYFIPDDIIECDVLWMKKGESEREKFQINISRSLQ